MPFQPLQQEVTNDFGTSLLVSGVITSIVGAYAEDVASNPNDIGFAGLSMRMDTQTPTTTNSGDYQQLKSDNEGALYVRQPARPWSAVSRVTASASTKTLLSANTARRGAIIFNDSTSVLRLKLGPSASTTSYSYYLAPGAHWELPFDYCDRVDGIWEVADGAAMVTEIV